MVSLVKLTGANSSLTISNAKNHKHNISKDFVSCGLNFKMNSKATS